MFERPNTASSGSADDGSEVDTVVRRRITPIRDVTILICGAPGDGTAIVADWLAIAAAGLGQVAEAVPLGGGPGAPHGTFVRIIRDVEHELEPRTLPARGVDVIVAGEHLELLRALVDGWADPHRTTIIASCVRQYGPAEESVAADWVISEQEIDRVATRTSTRYVAFDAPQVAGWYRLPAASQPAMLFGALCGSGALKLTADECRAAITRLGIAVPESIRAFNTALRMGRRAGGRIRRSLTAAQFTRKRRGALPRSQRTGFDRLIEQVDRDIHVDHRAQVRESVWQLVDFESAAYAKVFLDWCESVVRDEASASWVDGRSITPEESVVPLVARSLAAMLAHPDPAQLAHVRLRRQRLPELRKRHGITRYDGYVVHDHLAMSGAEIASIVPPRIGRHFDRTGSSLVSRHRTWRIATTTIGGAIRLRILASLRRYRNTSPRHLAEVDAAAMYVAAVRDAITTGQHDLVMIVARSGGIIEGSGVVRDACRASAMAFWGRIVRPALSVDRQADDPSYAFASRVIPHVYRHLCVTGPTALWEYAGAVLSISMQSSRGLSHARALEYAHALTSRTD